MSSCFGVDSRFYLSRVKVSSEKRARSYRTRMRRIIFSAMLATGISAASSAAAAEYVVTSHADSGAGSLREMIGLVNQNASQADIIRFDSSLSGQTISINSMLPLIAKNSGGSLNIIGLGADQLTISGQNQTRILWVDSGSVVVEGVKLADGLAQGGSGGDSRSGGGGGGGLGAGGALFVNASGNVTLRSVSLANNTAQGGNGGNLNYAAGNHGGGGGGGLSGNGGMGGQYAGGGGGGLGGNGGNGGFEGGGGGGGASQNGGQGSFSGGGVGGNEGGDGGDYGSNGEVGGTFGGGGGGGDSRSGGDGGEFGGGGGGGYQGNGGSGGFGGGGAGAGRFGGTAGAAGFGAGNGGAEEAGGDGGDGIGGAVFVRQGGSITLENVSFTSGAVAGGAGGTGDFYNGSNGEGLSANLYAMQGATTNFAMSSNSDMQLDGQNYQIDQLTVGGSGTVNVTGDATIDHGVVVNSGTFRVNANATTDVVVNTNGTLGGSGAIIGELILNGTLAPGNSIGTLTVNGNASFNSGSITTIEINDGGTVPGVNHDSIVVNGNVVISGGSVNVVSAPGNYTGGAVYTFLTANSVSGTFDSITDDLAFFDAFLIYGGNSVAFELIANMSDFSPIASTVNQASVASFLDANQSGTSADLQMIFDELTPLTNQQVRSSFDQMGGAIYATLPVASLQHTSYYLSQISGNIKNQIFSGNSASYNSESQANYDIEFISQRKRVTDSRVTGWVTGYGLGGRGHSDGNADGFHYGIGGTQVAVQREWNRGHSIGLWSNLAWSNVRGRELNERADIENYHFGTYLSGYEDGHYYVLMGGLGYDHAEVQRNISIGNLAASPSSKINGWQANTSLERGFSFDLNGWTVQPYGAMQYVYLRQGEARETGGGIFNLNVAGIDANSLRSSLGGRLKRSLRTGRGRIVTPEIRSAWIHEFLDTKYVAGASFSSLTSPGFTIQGLDLGRDWVSSGGGMSLGFGHGSRLFAGYDAMYNANQIFHVGSGGLEFVY